MKFKEIEFKYNASDISLTAFTEFCEKGSPNKIVQAAGYDHFYANPKLPGSFLRHRVGPDLNQLTFKRKLSDRNNFIRDEDNLDLLPIVGRAQVDSFAEKFGYAFTKSIFKTCFVYKYGRYTLVYYILADTELKEIGRYVEIELAEDVNWGTEEKAWETLTALEKMYKPLGITPQGRMRKSLYEIVHE